MAAHRRPFAAFLRRKHRPAIVIAPPERIECRHGLMRCDHCNPLWIATVRPSALSIPTKPYPLVRTQPTPYPDPVPHPTGPGGPR